MNDNLKWQEKSSLSDMKEQFNTLVDQLAGLANDLSDFIKMQEDQNAQTSRQLHNLDDTLLYLNLKLDQAQEDTDERISDVLRRISKMHPGA